VIAMIEGSVWGGATETVFACDFIVATETATFAVTPAKLGVPYNVGGMLTFLNATGLRIVASSAESVGELGLWQFPKLMIEHDFYGLGGSKTVGFPDAGFELVVKALNGAK
jgi:Enoyl-CoA hydratase/isomerase